MSPHFVQHRLKYKHLIQDMTANLPTIQHSSIRYIMKATLDVQQPAVTRTTWNPHLFHINRY